ncbi:MAG: YMGG-like glycine zipper-containing protein [Gammaproteobacteria bacterium]
MLNIKTYSSIGYFIFCSLLTFFSGTGLIQAQGIGAGTFAYPSKGQSGEQIQKDTMYCHNWAVSQTGFDPTRNYAPPPTYTTAPPSSSGGYFGSGETGQGGVVRDAAGGAALGAIGGAIAGDAGKGAAIGAVAGSLFGGVKRSSRRSEEDAWRQQQQQQQAQQQAAYQQQMNAMSTDYRRAYSACMTSRNYTVQ